MHHEDAPLVLATPGARAVAALPTLAASLARMIRKRGRYDAMAPIEEITWLVVADQYGDSLCVRELVPLTDPRRVMIEAMAHSIGLGFEVEELPGVIPIYYCRKGDERRSVSIVRKEPKPQKRQAQRVVS